MSTSAAAPLRVLTLSHMDPRLSRGGAELAAWQLHAAIRAMPGAQAWFLSAAPGRTALRPGITFGQPFGADSFLYGGGAFDHFTFSNLDPAWPEAFAALLRELRPDVVHIHHYANFGVETFQLIRSALPDARIVATLHEYLAICNHYGQMVKRPSFALCEASGPLPCHACFPEHGPEDFFLRRHFLLRFFDVVDRFVAPSAFLAGRYADWGIAPERIAVIGNGVPELAGRGAIPYPAAEAPLRIGFFGQISRLKGLDVALEAARLLHARGETRIAIEVHGDPSAQPAEFQERFRRQMEDVPPNFRYAGPYDNARVERLMGAVHAVLVPSIWWENSPVVIEEALAARRPVIASDIGGMAEKVRDGLDGFHFEAGSAASLAALLRRLADRPELLAGVQATLRRPPSIEETLAELLPIYRG